MPEGDAIFRTARTLDRALAGRVVTRFESVLPALTRVHEDAPVTGRIVEGAHSAGKHVLIRFSGDLVLRTHMRMNGSWHLYRPGERWRRSRIDMRIVIATAEFEAVAFRVPIAEFLPAAALDRQDDLRKMGPDLLSDDFDEAEALRRFREKPDEAVADVLLNQRVVAGAGNVYKSEVLFLCRIDPFAAVARLEDESLRCVLTTARRLLKANVGTLSGITTYTGLRQGPGGDASDRRYVYGRSGKPCRLCGTPIAVRPQGPHARLTYWCPKCQCLRELPIADCRL